LENLNILGHSIPNLGTLVYVCIHAIYLARGCIPLIFDLDSQSPARILISLKLKNFQKSNLQKLLSFNFIARIKRIEHRLNS
jgi:hypothetical protein